MSRRKIDYLQEEKNKLTENEIDMERHNRLMEVYSSVNRTDYDEYPYEELEKKIAHEEEYVNERCYPPGEKSSDLLNSVMRLLEINLSLQNQNKIGKMKKKKVVKKEETSEEESSEEEIVVKKKSKKEKVQKEPKISPEQMISMAEEKIMSDPMFDML